MSYNSAVYGELDTYTPKLRQALERCHAFPTCDEPAAYQVFEETLSREMPDVHAVVAECNSLREANERAVKYLIDEGFWVSGTQGGEIPEFDIVEGKFKCTLTTDGSMGGLTTISVRKASSNRRSGRAR